VAWSIDDEQTRNIDLGGEEIVAFANLLDEFFLGEECGTDLLGDTSSFSFLNVSPSDFVQQSGFTCIYMAENATNGTSEVSGLPGEKELIVLETLNLFFFSLLLVLEQGMLQFFLSDLLIVSLIFLFFAFFIDQILVELQSLSFHLELLRSYPLVVGAGFFFALDLGPDGSNSALLFLLALLLLSLYPFLLFLLLALVLNPQLLLLVLMSLLFLLLFFGKQCCSCQFGLLLALLLRVRFVFFGLLDLFLHSCAFCFGSQLGSFLLFLFLLLEFLELSLGETFGARILLLLAHIRLFLFFLTHRKS
jgi:hypothetical protein